MVHSLACWLIGKPDQGSQRPLPPPGSPHVSWLLVVLHVAACVLWSEWQQQVLLTRLMVIRTKQIIGLKLGSCFLLLPAAACLPVH